MQPQIICLRTDEDALTLALVLAITAPTFDRSQQAVEMAEELAARMSARAVGRCKKRAVQQLEEAA